MADIRINSLPTTASASSSDDFLALDGATNGTRKLNAFSPTFGGNLTVGGTDIKINNSTGYLYVDSGSSLTGMVLSRTNNILELYTTNVARLTISSAGNTTLAGNLTVNGAGTHSFAGQVTSTVNAANTSNLGSFVASNATLNSFTSYSPSASLDQKYWTWQSGTAIGDGTIRLRALNDAQNNGINAITVTRSGISSTAVTIGGNLTVSGTGNSGVAGGFYIAGSTVSPNNTACVDITWQSTYGKISAINRGVGNYPLALQPEGGNLLIGTTTDGGQKLQVNGTGYFGGDLTIPSSIVYTNRVYNYTGGATPLILGWTGSAAVLSLFSSGAATFSGAVTVSGTAQSSVARTLKVGALIAEGNLNAFTFVPNSTGLSAGYNYSGGSAETNMIFGAASPTQEMRFQRWDGTTLTNVLTLAGSGAATFAGAIAIGNTVNTVSPTSPNRTITMVIGGVTYYLHAKTTND
jgi:hypothetical protein